MPPALQAGHGDHPLHLAAAAVLSRLAASAVDVHAVTRPAVPERPTASCVPAAGSRRPSLPCDRCAAASRMALAARAGSRTGRRRPPAPCSPPAAGCAPSAYRRGQAAACRRCGPAPRSPDDGEPQAQRRGALRRPGRRGRSGSAAARGSRDWSAASVAPARLAGTWRPSSSTDSRIAQSLFRCRLPNGIRRRAPGTPRRRSCRPRGSPGPAARKRRVAVERSRRRSRVRAAPSQPAGKALLGQQHGRRWDRWR